MAIDRQEVTELLRDLLGSKRMTITEAVRVACISRQTYYNLVREDNDFARFVSKFRINRRRMCEYTAYMYLSDEELVISYRWKKKSLSGLNAIKNGEQELINALGELMLATLRQTVEDIGFSRKVELTVRYAKKL